MKSTDNVAVSESKVSSVKEFTVPANQSLVYKNCQENSEKHQEKTEDVSDFWDMKGVIRMDPTDETRCHHTTVPPSAMMALAMELLVSNRGKACKIFREAKRKAQEDDVDDDANKEKETNLVNLWVVPDCETNVRTETPSTASHLQPSLVNSDFVLRPNSQCSESPPLLIHPDFSDELNDVELEDLKNISVTDLVGSADHVIAYPDTDEDEWEMRKKKRGRKHSEEKRKKEKHVVFKDKIQDFSTYISQQPVGDKMTDDMRNGANPVTTCDTSLSSSSGEMSTIAARDRSVSEIHFTKALPSGQRASGLSGFNTPVEISRTGGSHAAKPVISDLHANDKLLTERENDYHQRRESMYIKNDGSFQAKVMNNLDGFNARGDKRERSYKDECGATDELGGVTSQICKESCSAISPRKFSFRDSDSQHSPKANLLFNSGSEEIAEPRQLTSWNDGNLTKTEIVTEDLNLIGTSCDSNQDFARSLYRGLPSINCVSSPQPARDSNASTLSSSASLSSSLCSLSSLESLSSASLHLSSIASEVMSSASCPSITPDSSDFHEKTSTPRLGRSSLKHNCESGDAPSNHRAKAHLGPFRASQGCVNGPLGGQNVAINNDYGCSTGKHKASNHKSCLTVEGGHELARASPNTLVTVLSGGAGRSEDGRRSRTPSRKVVCQFANEHSSKEGVKSFKPVISQAVFPDVEDSTIATPVLYLKKTAKYCPDCDCKMSWCCCGKPNKRSSFRGKDNKPIAEYVENKTEENIPTTNVNTEEQGKTIERKNSIKQILIKKGVFPKKDFSQMTDPIVEGRRRSKRFSSSSSGLRLIPEGDDQVVTLNDQIKSIQAGRSNVATNSHSDGCRVSLKPIHTSDTEDTHFNNRRVLERHLTENEQLSGGERSFNDMATTSQQIGYQEEQVKRSSLVNLKREIPVKAEIVDEQVQRPSFESEVSENAKKESPVKQHPRVTVMGGSRLTLRKPAPTSPKDGSQGAKISTKGVTDSAQSSKTDSALHADRLMGEKPVTPATCDVLHDKPVLKEKITSHYQDPESRQHPYLGKEQRTTAANINRRLYNNSNSLNIGHQNELLDSKVCNPSVDSAASEALINSSIADDITSTAVNIPVVVEQVDQVRDGTQQSDEANQGFLGIERSATASPLVKFEEQEAYTVTTVEEQNEVTFKTLRKLSITSESTVEIDLNDCRSVASSDNEMPSGTLASALSKGYGSPGRPSSYRSSVTLSLRPTSRSSLTGSARLSPTIEVAKDSSESHQQTSANERNVMFTKEIHPDYRKWVRSWTSAVDGFTAEEKVFVQKEGQEFGHNDAMAHTDRLSPSTMGGCRPPSGSNRRPSPSRVILDYNPQENRIGILQKEFEKEDMKSKVMRIETTYYDGMREMVGNNGDDVKVIPQPPPHSTVDEEEFCGVVEAPTLKVKEIRAKYKARDHKNYGKPASVSSTSSGSRKSSEDTSPRHVKGSSQSDFDSTENLHGPNHVVAQQVMDLFKGALDIEKELSVFEEERYEMHKQKNATPLHNGHVTSNVKVVKSTTVTRPPVAQKPNQGNTNTWPPSKQTHVDLKASVAQIKTESQAVTSFDESLDQFYDVLNDLSL
ncbi:unnamed protein product [Clavelina lepadiformis]|uniref:Uncharacterized protein n=1 Tax=Clavelina lepadiformis TaxID=159417 RepID=A0ABP0FX97_CLALP